MNANTKQTYAVIVTEPNARNSDGSPVIVRRCGHEHRSIAAAQRCCESLTRPYPDGSRPAKWWGAAVRHYDGDLLTEAEYDNLYQAVFRGGSGTRTSSPPPTTQNLS